jgi:hypothetical protein
MCSGAHGFAKSFMLIKLLQHFDAIDLAPDAQPADSKPPAEWASAPGRKSKEKFFPKTHLTMYSLVRLITEVLHGSEANAASPGRFVGSYEGS